MYKDKEIFLNYVTKCLGYRKRGNGFVCVCGLMHQEEIKLILKLYMLQKWPEYLALLTDNLIWSTKNCILYVWIDHNQHWFRTSIEQPLPSSRSESSTLTPWVANCSAHLTKHGQHMISILSSWKSTFLAAATYRVTLPGATSSSGVLAFPTDSVNNKNVKMLLDLHDDHDHEV